MLQIHFRLAFSWNNSTITLCLQMESWFICWDHSLSSSCGHCNFPLPPLEVEPLPTPAPRTSHPLGFAYWWIFKANQTIFASARPLCKQILLDHILHKTRNPISYLLSCAYYFSSHHCFFNSSSCVILLQQHHSKLHRIQILLLLHLYLQWYVSLSWISI